uniref:Uncharacterized protein n=1 Tax=Salarias fasciatus TaxID=181472 RepID=A0A672FLE9_SALFA
MSVAWTTRVYCATLWRKRTTSSPRFHGNRSIFRVKKNQKKKINLAVQNGNTFLPFPWRRSSGKTFLPFPWRRSRGNTFIPFPWRRSGNTFLPRSSGKTFLLFPWRRSSGKTFLPQNGNTFLPFPWRRSSGKTFLPLSWRQSQNSF